jgi:hypothetical protein
LAVPPANSRVDRLLLLEKSHGNQAVARMIRSGAISTAIDRPAPSHIARSRALAARRRYRGVQRVPEEEDGDSQELKPVLGGEAIATLKARLPAVKAKHGRVFDFEPFENELVLGGMTVQLLRFQPSYKLAAVKQYIDAEWKKGWEHLRFSGNTIADKTPQQWYVEVNHNRNIPDADKPNVHAVVYSAFILRAVRDAVQLKGWSEQRTAHGQAPLSGDYGNVLLFRCLVEELASRMPRNLAFNENRFGKHLLQITRNRLTRTSVPYYVDPPECRPDQTLTFQQAVYVSGKRPLSQRIRMFMGMGPEIKSSKDNLEDWASTASARSLVFTVLSAKEELKPHWEVTLKAREIMPSELEGLIAREQQRAREAYRLGA